MYLYFLGNGTGGFGNATNFAVADSVFSVAVGDFNGRRQTRLAMLPAGTRFQPC